jgi:hypothetical protein
MRSALLVLSAAAGLSAALSPATGKPAPMLEPTTPWYIDYADSNCRLIRKFGEGDASIKLVFEQVAPREPVSVLLEGNVRADGRDNVLAFESLPDVQIGQGQAHDTVKSSERVVYWPRMLGRGRWGLITEADAARMRKADPVAAERSSSAPSDLSAPRLGWQDHDWRAQPDDEWRAEDAAFSARADQVTAVVLNPKRYGSVSLRTGGLAKPFQALEQCASDSLKDWGIDRTIEATIAIGAHPVEDPHKLFGPNDYPQEALKAFVEDNLEVWLNIDAQGGITNCRVISDFASPQINDAICEMVRRKERFVPARTKDGTSVPDFYTENFVFKLG